MTDEVLWSGDSTLLVVAILRVFGVLGTAIPIRPPLSVIDVLVRLIPDYFAYELRAGLYRWAGCQFGPGVQIYGRLTLHGRQVRPQLLSIGAGSNVAPHCVLNLDGPIRIGSLVGLAPFVKVFTSASAPVSVSERETNSGRGGTPRPVSIEDGAVVMTGATILPGVTVGRGAIVGAGAVVTDDVEPNTFVGGVPANLIRRLSEGSRSPTESPSRA
jgi:acetyltransferase-like isoleucine patch superfamily enzyme